MTTKKLLSLPRLATFAGVVLLAAVAATTASAGSGGGCPTYQTVQPFKPWADTGNYFLGPSGSFETSLTGWTVKGAAKLVSGNETYYVHAKTDKSSLSLPSGSSITSPSICVTLDTPDLRLFVLNTGSATALLNVVMTYTDNSGKPHTATVAQLTGGSTWSPSIPVLFLANINSILSSNNCTWVTFTFAPVGSNGKWQIDDFYVDPVKHH
jgi:hypothetical protein